MKIVLLKIIRLYQKTLSRDHGLLKILKPFGQCRFYPTCSEFSYQAIEKYGIIKGGFMSAKRLLRCNPCSKGGVDQI
ncbi:MAG: membrane protein insertion efficiency factor YidD [Patescibacteria group bacterium]